MIHLFNIVNDDDDDVLDKLSFNLCMRFGLWSE